MNNDTVEVLKRLSRTIRRHDYMKTRNMSHRKKVQYQKHVAWTQKAPIADVLALVPIGPVYVFEGMA